MCMLHGPMGRCLVSSAFCSKFSWRSLQAPRSPRAKQSMPSLHRDSSPRALRALPPPMCAMNMSSMSVLSRRSLQSKLLPPGAMPPCCTMISIESSAFLSRGDPAHFKRKPQAPLVTFPRLGSEGNSSVSQPR